MNAAAREHETIQMNMEGKVEALELELTQHLDEMASHQAQHHTVLDERNAKFIAFEGTSGLDDSYDCFVFLRQQACCNTAS